VKDAAETVVLDRVLAAAFQEWRAAAADLDGRFAAYERARQRHSVALAKWMRLAMLSDS